MNNTKYVNKKHQITVEVIESEFFDTHALVTRKGKLEFNGIVNQNMVQRMVKEMALVRA